MEFNFFVRQHYANRLREAKSKKPIDWKEVKFLTDTLNAIQNPLPNDTVTFYRQLPVVRVRVGGL